MTDEKWIALLGFLVTACGILSTFPPLAQYSAWFVLAASLIGAFLGSWFGVKPAYQLRQENNAAVEKANELMKD